MNSQSKIKNSIRLKVLYRKNLKMTANKLAAQVTHCVLKLAREQELDLNSHPDEVTIIVLGVSDKKFEENIQDHLTTGTVFRDKGATEVDPNTATTMAFVQDTDL